MTTLCSCAALLLGAFAALPIQAEQRTGYILVSSDKELPARIAREMRLDSDFSKYLAKFDAGRLTLFDADEAIPIIIDFGTGALATAREKAALLEGLAANLEPTTGGGLVGSMSTETQKAIASFLSGRTLEGSKIENGAVGLGATLAIDVEGPSGEKKTFRMMPSNDLTERRNEYLQKHPLPARRRTQDPEQQEKEVQELTQRSRDRNLITIHFMGAAAKDPRTSHKRASEVVDEQLTALASKEQAGFAALLSKFGSMFGESGVGPGEVGFSQLPKALQDQLLKSIEHGYGAYGFGSADEAESFLRNSRSLSVTTTLMLAICNRPSDPASGKPALFDGYGIGTVKGTLPP